MPWPSSCQVAWLILLATSSCGALAEWLQAIRSSKEVTRRCSMRSCGKPGQHIRHDVPQRYQAVSRWSKAAPPTSPSCIEPHKHTGWWGWHIHWGSRSAFLAAVLAGLWCQLQSTWCCASTLPEGTPELCVGPCIQHVALLVIWEFHVRKTELTKPLPGDSKSRYQTLTVDIVANVANSHLDVTPWKELNEVYKINRFQCFLIRLIVPQCHEHHGVKVSPSSNTYKWEEGYENLPILESAEMFVYQTMSKFIDIWGITETRYSGWARSLLLRKQVNAIKLHTWINPYWSTR